MHEKQWLLMHEKKAAEKPKAGGEQDDLLTSALEYKSRTGIYSFPAAHSNNTILRCVSCPGTKYVVIDSAELSLFRDFQYSLSQ